MNSHEHHFPHMLLSFLRSRGPVLAKTWDRDGSIKSYGAARSFTLNQEPCNSLADLHTLLRRHQTNPEICLIRGTPRPGVKAGDRLRRKLDTFDDVASHLCVIDVDDFTPSVDVLAAPDAAVAELVDTLPYPFQGSNYVYQLSGSCGHPSTGGRLKVHLFFWLDKPMRCDELEAWAAKYMPQTDNTVHRTVQANYTANPMLLGGQIDPLEGRRLKAVDGLLGLDTVVIPADMPVPDLTRQRAFRANGRAMVDPRDKPGLVGAFCRVYGPEDLVTLAPDLFAEGSRPHRITWLEGGGTPEGVCICDNGTHLYNSHATTPVANAANLFDFLLAHKFGELDADVAPDVLQLMGPMDTPAAKAMTAWVLSLPGMREEVAESARLERSNALSKAAMESHQAGVTALAELKSLPKDQLIQLWPAKVANMPADAGAEALQFVAAVEDHSKLTHLQGA